MIIEILNEKRKQLRSDGPEAKLTIDDINALMDVNELRVLKITNPMPKDFVFSQSKEESFKRLLEEDSIYRTLEYCVISHPVLQISVGKVYKQWRFINGPRTKLRDRAPFAADEQL